VELGKFSGRINAVFAGDLIAGETMMQAADTSVEALPVATTLDQESSRKRQGCFFESARLPDSYRAVNCVGR
jgi:hypothetical protein